MKNLNKKILLIALILSIITAYSTYAYLKNLNNAENKPEYIQLIVASRDILSKEKITQDMLKKVKVIKGTHVVTSVQDMDKIVGMYAKEKILKGEVIPEDRLYKENEKNLSFRIPNGKRAISIAVNEIIGVGDMVKPGDYVDIYVTVNEKRIDGKYSTTLYPDITKLLLQNVKVLAIEKEQFPNEEERKEIPNMYSVTLAVSPLDGEKLILGEEIGSLRLALRPLQEDTIYETPGAIREDLVPNKGVRDIPK